VVNIVIYCLRDQTTTGCYVEVLNFVHGVRGVFLMAQPHTVTPESTVAKET
jgi:hypothetical protein